MRNADGLIRTRMVEWLLATLLLAWGVMCLALPGEMLSNATNRYLLSLAPELGWGIIAVSLGGFRIAGLAINGNWRRTPLLRLCGAWFGVLFWLLLFCLYMVAVSHGAIPFPTLAFYPIFILFEAVSIFRCSQDARDMGSLQRRPRNEAA